MTLKLVLTFSRKQLFLTKSWMKMLAVSLSPLSPPLDKIMNQREGLTDVNEAIGIRLSCDDVETCPDLSEEAAVCVQVMDEDVSCLPHLSLSLSLFSPFPLLSPFGQNNE